MMFIKKLEDITIILFSSTCYYLLQRRDMKAGLRTKTVTMKTAHVYGAGAERKHVHK